MTDITGSAHFTAPDVPIAEAAGDFYIARVFEGATSMLRQHFFTFFAIYVVIHLPIMLYDHWAVAPGGVVAGLVRMFSGTLGQAVICYGAYQHMCGRGVNLTESVQAFSRNAVPIVWLQVCVGILVTLASIALVIPGLVLVTMWYVATPACVIEKLGVGASLRRSSELTKGHRWKVFGLLLTLVLAGALVGGVTVGLQHAVGGTTFKLLTDIIIMNGLLGTISSVFTIAAYHDLRVAKEGPELTRIATVFA